MADSFMPNWFGAGKYDETTRKEFDRYLGDFIRFQKNTFTPCYISAAIIRGWEVYDSIDTLQPVFDERQEKMAEELVKLFAKCKLRIFAKGIEEHVLSGSGISRVLFGGQ
jgi:chromosome condensin MukBEF complex kleisin-like MukF subunit